MKDWIKYEIQMILFVIKLQLQWFLYFKKYV